ncbi:MAG: phytanoyl-CoA dioxygenase family protein [Candidatus Obscuribacterales bacterium]|nr:phytanoyl-CoA dioxygenase family protein [Candidatus Obscuribacterales bacterium]
MTVSKGLKYRFDLSDGFCREDFQDSLSENGFAVLESVISKELCADTLLRIEKIAEQLNSEHRKLGLPADSGLAFIPALMSFDPHFFQFLEIPELLETAEFWLGKDGILRNQFAQFVEPQKSEHEERLIFHRFHRNFRHLLDAPKVCLDSTLVLSDMTERNGCIYMLPGSHKCGLPRGIEELQSQAVEITAKAGSAIFLDGMTWHREEHNFTDEKLVLLNHQFTRPIIKQYFDFPRLLPESSLSNLPERSKELLGFNSRVPSTLSEFFMGASSEALRRKNCGTESHWVLQS